MRVMIAGGGTGGHLFPGMAVAEELLRRDEKTQVLFVGTEHGIEARVVPKEGYMIKFLRVEGFVGRSALKKAKAAALMCLSFFESAALIREMRPDIVIGTGGYASFSPALVACLKKIPVLVMEQNVVPGVSTRLLGRFADAVAVTYHESLSMFPNFKTYLTGNPVRSAVLSGERLSACRLFSLDPGRFTVFVFGGSQGARSINNAMISALNHMLDLKGAIQFIHQTGDRDFEGVREAYRKLGYTGAVAPFIYRMAEAYAVADVIVSRAGASTLAEITAIGKPSILIPFPYAAHGHQEFNARKLAEAGAAVVMNEEDLDGEALAETVRKMLSSEELRAGMRRQSRMMGRPEAARKVADLAISLVNSRIQLSGGRGARRKTKAEKTDV